MVKKKSVFKKVYFVYLSVLILLMVLCVLYVSRLLQKYEDTLPEKCVENAIEDFRKMAENGTLWDHYFLSDATLGIYEKNLNINETYSKCFLENQVEYTPKSGDYPEDEKYYELSCNGALLAEVKLKAAGPAETKLIILNYREWETEYIKPVIEKTDYTLTLPSDFSAKANGIEILSKQQGDSTEDGENNNICDYVIEGVYFAPVMEIYDGDGAKVNYSYKEHQIVADYYYYDLTLPDTLSVKMNGKDLSGENDENHQNFYQIRELKQPEIIISDLYGNEYAYQGGKLPLTHKLISTGEDCQVMVEGVLAPEKASEVSADPEYDMLYEYVKELPTVNLYNIAVLKDNAQVSVIDKDGEETLLSDDRTEYSFTVQDNSTDVIPEEISDEVDVLKMAQNWSLFMSADLSFKEMSQYLIKDSYQYEAAYKYATGVDIKFVSAHTLGNPAFSDETVGNFVRITEDSFSVDISFVKNMVLPSGAKRKDPMNDRFYFVKYDDTDDGSDNPKWKIVSMKEIVNDAK